MYFKIFTIFVTILIFWQSVWLFFKYHKFLFGNDAVRKDHVMICPYCGSDNVGNDLSLEMIAWDGSTRYLCHDCDYSGVLFPKIIKSELKIARKEIADKREIDKKILAETSISKGFTNKYIVIGIIGINIGGFIAGIIGIISGLFFIENDLLLFTSAILVTIMIILFFKPKMEEK